MNWRLSFPLLASVLYVIAALFLKRAQQLGAGTLRTTFCSNIAIAISFIALLPLGGNIPSWTLLWQPALVAFLFISGQAFTVLALAKGDVSVATPVLGAKTVFVAWFTTIILATQLPWQLWTAAFLSTAAIALFHFAPMGRTGSGSHLRTIVLSLLAAATYGIFDVLVQKWSPAWGAGRFLPIMFAIGAVMSCAFIPFFPEPLRTIPRACYPSLLAGAALWALQSVALVSSVAIFGDATPINVVYSSRGVWSVIAVWLIGHWFANEEGMLDRRALLLRTVGAGMMAAAIVLVINR